MAVAGYVPLKSLSLRERTWTFASGLESDAAVAVELQLVQPIRSFRQFSVRSRSIGAMNVARKTLALVQPVPA
jgi:hypothetical protein